MAKLKLKEIKTGKILSILPEENVPLKVKQLYEMVRAAPEGSNNRYATLRALEAYMYHYSSGRSFQEFAEWALRTLKFYNNP